MKFPNAADGVKKIFTSEILMLIGTVCAGIALLMGLLAVESDKNAMIEGVTDSNAVGALAGGAGFLVFSLGAAVLVIIALIINIIGLNKASKDEEDTNNFKVALFLLIASVVLTGVGSVFTNSQPNMAKWLNVGGEVASLISTYYILDGIASLAEKINNQELADKSRKLIIAVLCLHIFGLVAERIPDFMSAGSLGTGLAIGLAVVGLVLTIVSYVVYLVVLSQAKKAFAEA
jgi:hypothetical protein